MLFWQSAVSYQCEVLEGIALAIIQNSPEPHAEQLHCHCCEGRYPGVCLQFNMCTIALYLCLTWLHCACILQCTRIQSINSIQSIDLRFLSLGLIRGSGQCMHVCIAHMLLSILNICFDSGASSLHSRSETQKCLWTATTHLYIGRCFRKYTRKPCPGGSHVWQGQETGDTLALSNP